MLLIILHCYFTSSFILTSHSEKPVRTGTLILAAVFSRTGHVLQLQCALKHCTVATRRIELTLVYLVVLRIEAFHRVFRLVWWFGDVTLNVEVFTLQGHEHSGLQGQCCVRTKHRGQTWSVDPSCAQSQKMKMLQFQYWNYCCSLVIFKPPTNIWWLQLLEWVDLLQHSSW